MEELFIFLILGAVCIVLILSASLIGSSVHRVELNKFGLAYDKNNKKVFTDIEREGVYMSGIGMKFIEYPTKNIIFEFAKGGDSPSIEAWTINGQTVTIEISFFCKFTTRDGKMMRNFFYNYGGSSTWKPYFVRIAETKIKDTTTGFDELSFYEKREEIDQGLLQALNEEFYLMSYGVLNVTDVQLRQISLEDELERAVQDKLIQLQNQRYYEIEQQIKIIQKTTELIQQYAANNVTIIYSEAESTAIQTRQEAEAQAIYDEYTGYAKAFRELDREVNFSDNTALFGMMLAESLTKFNKNTNLNLGFAGSGVLLDNK